MTRRETPIGHQHHDVIARSGTRRGPQTPAVNSSLRDRRRRHRHEPPNPSDRRTHGSPGGEDRVSQIAHHALAQQTCEDCLAVLAGEGDDERRREQRGRPCDQSHVVGGKRDVDDALRHERSDGCEADRRLAERRVGRAKRRRHQRMRVELALEVELYAVVPVRKDRADRRDDLAHARRGLRPRHAEPPRDVRLDLRAEPECQAATRVRIEVVRMHRKQHRIARKRDRDARHQSQVVECPAASSNGRNGSCAASPVHDAVKAERFEPGRLVTHAAQVRRQVRVNAERLHERLRCMRACPVVRPADYATLACLTLSNDASSFVSSCSYLRRFSSLTYP